MFDLIANFSYEYYWIPNVIGFIWSFYIAFKDPQSRVKTLICLQFWIVLFVSEIFSAVGNAVSPEQAFSLVTHMSVISTLIQIPVVFIIAKKYLDSDRGVVLVFATILTVVCNAILIFDHQTGLQTIWKCYNQAMFLISCLAIGSCHKGFSHGFARLLFGCPSSRRSYLRRSLVDRILAK